MSTLRSRILATILVSSALGAGAIKTGPAVGASVPDFQLPDQNGVTQTLGSIAGSEGAMIVFYRSADW